MPFPVARYTADREAAVVFWQPSAKAWKRMLWTAGFDEVEETNRFNLKPPEGWGVRHVVHRASGLVALGPADHDVFGDGGFPAPDGVANPEWFGVTHAQPAGVSERRVTSLAFDALARLWSPTPPPTMSNVTVTVLGPNITVSWTTSEPATSELQIGVNGETNRDGGDMNRDNTIFRLAANPGGLRTSHSVTVFAPTSDPGVCQKVVPRSFTADGRSVTTNPRIAGCPSTGRFE